MTERLYYHDSFLYDFDGEIVEVVPAAGGERRTGVILDRTAFYPASGGQVHDTGWITARDAPSGAEFRVTEIAERDDGKIVHYIEAERAPEKGGRVRGRIDVERRLDHMQQHSGQHVLSAAFIALFQMATVSFHMGEEYCSIDLDTAGLTREQVAEAERFANQVVLENRDVSIRFVTPEEAQTLGLRKIPAAQKEQLRLIDIHDFDLTACGGTHVRGTGQIGAILLRKFEKARQGWRLEFVCGQRAVSMARRDYTVLNEAASLFSGQMTDVPQQIRKTLEEAKAARKTGEELLEEIAELHAKQLLAETAERNGRKIVARVYAERGLGFIKLVAQKIARSEANAVALLAATSGQVSLVFAQSPGQPFDMGTLLKETVMRRGGRGGGSKDMAQGGVASAEGLEGTLAEIVSRLAQ